MNTETMIRELNAVAEKHKKDFVTTFQTNITAMCRDIIPKLEKLKKYEDTEEKLNGIPLMRLADAYISTMEKDTNEKYSRGRLLTNEDADKWDEYKNAEEQGKILRLPCNVGDTVYEVQEIRHRIQPLEIISIYIGRMGKPYFYWELKDGIGIYQNVKGFGESRIGKDVFLTREEAEAALHGRRKVKYDC